MLRSRSSDYRSVFRAKISGVPHEWQKKSKTKVICVVCQMETQALYAPSEKDDCYPLDSYRYQTAMERLGRTRKKPSRSRRPGAVAYRPGRVESYGGGRSGGRSSGRCPDCGSKYGWAYGKRVGRGQCECTASY